MSTTLRIPYIAVDKYVAIPYTPINTDQKFPLSSAYYQLSIQVYNNDGSLPTKPVDVYIGTDQNPRRMQYWDSNQKDITDQIVTKQEPVQTDVHGHLSMYMAVATHGDPKYPGCIFEVFASPTKNDKTDSVNQTLTCCYYNYDDAMKVADMNLTPLVPPVDDDGVVAIPDWSTYAYSLSTKLNSLSPDVSSSAKVSIVVNGKRIDRPYSYGSLYSPGVEIPYDLMIAGDQPGTNCIVYITDDGSPRLSVPWQFNISGVPLLMPDPTKEAPYGAPWWWGASQGQPPATEPMTLDDLYISNDAPGFDVAVAFQEGVQAGDVYRVFIYMNGYDPDDGTPKTQLLGDGHKIGNSGDGSNIFTIIAPEGAAKGQVATVAAPIALCAGFAQKDATHPGYLWVNYQINGRDWSGIYVASNTPVFINFGNLSSDDKPREGK